MILKIHQKMQKLFEILIFYPFTNIEVKNFGLSPKRNMKNEKYHFFIFLRNVKKINEKTFITFLCICFDFKHA